MNFNLAITDNLSSRLGQEALEDGVTTQEEAVKLLEEALIARKKNRKEMAIQSSFEANDELLRRLS